MEKREQEKREQVYPFSVTIAINAAAAITPIYPSLTVGRYSYCIHINDRFIHLNCAATCWNGWTAGNNLLTDDSLDLGILYPTI